MKNIIYSTLFLLLITIIGIYISFFRDPCYDEMQSCTARIAASIAKDDQKGLENETILHGEIETIKFLLQFHTVLVSGYEIAIRKNGEGGFHLLDGIVTHIGIIKTSTIKLCLGFNYDRKTDKLEFISASYSGTF